MSAIQNLIDIFVSNNFIEKVDIDGLNTSHNDLCILHDKHPLHESLSQEFIEGLDDIDYEDHAVLNLDSNIEYYKFLNNYDNISKLIMHAIKIIILDSELSDLFDTDKLENGTLNPNILFLLKSEFCDEFAIYKTIPKKYSSKKIFSYESIYDFFNLSVLLDGKITAYYFAIADAGTYI